MGARHSWTPTGGAAVLVLLAVGPAAAAFNVKKCCAEGEAFGAADDDGNVQCVALSETDRVAHKFEVPKLVNESGPHGVYNADEYTLSYGKPLDCDSEPTFSDPRKDPLESFSVTKEGHILNSSGSVFLSSVYPFCLEMDNTFFLSLYSCSRKECILGSSPECPPCEPHVYNEYCPRPKVSYYLILMEISLPFLIATFFVYAFIKELQNVHGKSLMCHVASLFFAYCVFIYSQYHTLEIKDDNETKMTVCRWLAYMQQFAFMATFFWLNAMCFEMWWNFRKATTISRESEKKKFIIYSIYAWGCSILISIITFIMEQLVKSEYSPKFAHSSCWFNSTETTFIYFNGPISIILFCNLLMFIHTLIMVMRHTHYAETFAVSERRKNNQNKENQKLLLSLKLFIVMGLSWILEIWINQKSNNDWFIWNIVNALQGVLIFIIFVCRKPVLRLLNRKICPQYTLVKPANDETNSADHTDIQI